ncbi:hypothetical protein HMI55_002522 [Coelomomyces lativittatus]|nr:hypothetical protein HMI55_002522 [Coelomomyces lativittatus]
MRASYLYPISFLLHEYIHLYYGSLFQSTTGFLERFSTPILFLEFDFDNTLYSLKSSFPNLPVREDLDPEATLSQAMLVQKPSDASCYIEAVNLMGSTDPKYTRVNGLSNDLPDAIFLDYKATYEFTLEVSPVFGTPLSKVKAGFVLSHRDWISVNTVRIEDYHLNLVKYLVTLQDSGDFNEQQLPEAIKSSTTLFILIYDSTYCIDYTPRSIVIYSGCPPFQTIEVGKPKKTMCIDPNPKYPCQYVDEDYLPTFYLVDMVTSQKVRFNLSYTLQVVGGGLSLSNLSNFPADKISTINSQTWGPADDLPQLSDGRYVFKASKNALFFICAGESPCAKVFPQFPNPAQYYFITLMTNKGISENRTYCELQLLYVFRLHGLNVDFLTASLITFLTFAVTLALVLGIAMIRFMKTKRELLKVGISDVQFKSRTLMGKSNSIKPGTSNEKLAGTSGTKKSTQDLRSNLAAGKSILKSRSLVPEENY